MFQYELKYICDDTEVVYKFDAGITADEFIKHIRNFMAAATWTPEVINKYLGDDEE